MIAPAVSDLRYCAAPPAHRRRGLLGYLSFRYGDLALDGVTLRRTAHGHLALSFPKRVDRYGATHSLVRPWDHAARTTIEAEVLELLGGVDAD